MKKFDFSKYSTDDLDKAYLLNEGDPGFTKAVGEEIDRRVISRLKARNKNKKK